MTQDADFREPTLRDRDFIGAFAVIESEAGILMVQNERRIDGRLQHVWDLPGGQVQPGELLEEAVARELEEETSLQVDSKPEFLFFQDGERLMRGQRVHAWRSFFFAIDSFEGEPRAQAEVLDVGVFARSQLAEVLHAPYHDSFLHWLQRGGSSFRSQWQD